jgi:hypothetical protein
MAGKIVRGRERKPLSKGRGKKQFYRAHTLGLDTAITVAQRDRQVAIIAAFGFWTGEIILTVEKVKAIRDTLTEAVEHAETFSTEG